MLIIMPERPSKELVATLEGLGLATADQVARMGRRVRRLAKDLPRFDSVWIDALAQARVLTPFQAAELNAGRGGRLRVGPYVLCERLPYPLFAEGFRARNVENGEVVRLVVVDRLPSPPAPLPPAGEGRIQAATPQYNTEPWVEGKTAAQWMVQYGRFPPEVVLEIVRSMLVGLTEWEALGVCHGDISASSLILTYTGEVDLPWPGLRGRLRPEEGYAKADLPPEAFDGMAPERISQGTPTTTAADIFACGCLWWRMLCGRPPLAGGDALAKLRAAEECNIRDVREYAPDAPTALTAAISACVRREPAHRPESMARLAATLGPPTRDGREALIRAMNRTGRSAVRWSTTVRSVRRSSRTPLWLAGAACALATVVALFWPVGGRKSEFSGRRHVGHGRAERAQAPPAAKRSAPKTKETDKVIPVVHQEPVEPPAVVELWTHRPNKATEIKLHAGQCVRAPPGSRAEVFVPRAGLIVDKENVCFENIDFRWDGAAGGDQRENAEAALVRLTASEASFQGCRFIIRDGKDDNASAIFWEYPPRGERSPNSLPSERIALTDCLIDVSEAGIDCRTVGAVAVHFANVLHIGRGPLVRLDHCPRPDESVSLALRRATLRGGPLLECYVSDATSRPGEISVLATASVFMPSPDSPLLLLQSVASPRLFPNCLRWTGQGSLVAPRTPIIGWRGPDDRQRIVLDESKLSIAGLVRSELVFAGAATSDTRTSRIIHWQAPVQSSDSPGIDPGRLPLGK
ncbi:MAG: protein kinase [Pirellulales bacterium]|nr:protein kinase [Pirellulales bacterium]